MRWEVLLVRESKNKLNTNINRDRLKKVAEAAAENRSLGFSAKVEKLKEPLLIADKGGTEMYRYVVRLRIEKANDPSDANVNAKYAKVLEVVTKTAKGLDWDVVADPTQPAAFATADPETPIVEATRLPFKMPDLTRSVFGNFFHGVYEREPHIRTLHSAIRTCVESDGAMLSHVLLYGLPGACKTVLVKRFKAWYEADLPSGAVPRVMLLNNISTTKAGLENMLLDLAEQKALPHVVVIDEIEKQPLDNLLCMNTIMSEGIITKLNANVGHRREDAALTVVGICNDEDKLRSFQNGHLWSRFTHKVRCVRPSKELCLKILQEEAVTHFKGTPEWAELAIKFGWDELGQRDIRELRGHLDGREDLVSGSWQKWQRQMLDAARREDALRIASERESA